MAWAKLDDRWDDHRKIKRAWLASRAAPALHAMAITYSARHELNGRVDDLWLGERLPNKRERDQAVAALVDAGLFDRNEKGELWVHDYLDYNPSREKLEAKRERDRERKAKGGANGKPGQASPDSTRNPHGIQADSESPGPARPGPAPTPNGVGLAAGERATTAKAIAKDVVSPAFGLLDDANRSACIPIIEMELDAPWGQIAAEAVAKAPRLPRATAASLLDMALKDWRSDQSRARVQPLRPEPQRSVNAGDLSRFDNLGEGAA